MSEYSPKNPRTNILQLFFCAGFSCTSQHGDTQCRSLCLLLVFALRVTVKWSFHMGSNMTKKSSYTSRKRAGLLFLYQFPCWLFQHACDIKGVCHVQLVHQLSLDSRVNKPPKFSESFYYLMQIIKLESKYFPVLLNSAGAWESYRKSLYKQNKTIGAAFSD